MDKSYYYEYEQDSYYCYPDTFVLKNKLNLKNADKLKMAERDITSIRILQALINRVPDHFDFNHLKKIHRFIFGDIYDWAGKVRIVNISKGNQFCLCVYIQEQMDDIFNKLRNENNLKDYKNKQEVARRLAYYLGEINSIHPFREGNGRTQRLFMEHLAFSLGYSLDYIKISKDEILEASAKAFMMDYRMMEDLMFRALSAINEE